MHGPRIGGREIYLFAFLDDHSRLICGYRFGFAEDTVRLGAALEPALAARGVPASVYVDIHAEFAGPGHRLGVSTGAADELTPCLLSGVEGRVPHLGRAPC